MANLKTYLLLIGLFLAPSAHTNAQKSPLIITGTVIEVKPDGPLVTPRVLKNNRYERQETYFAVRLRLQYHNRGETTLIVPKPNFFYGKKSLLFLELPSPDAKVSAAVDEWMHPGWNNSAAYLFKELEHVEPPSGIFAVIEPGGYYECGETIRAKSGYKLDVRPSRDKFRRDLEFAIPEHSSFKIRYTFSLKDRPESAEPLADAGRRWRAFGKLLLNSDGDFFLESEVIINKLPD